MSSPVNPLQRPPIKPKAINCPNCGNAVALRAMGAASSVVCESCSSVLDARDANLKVLAFFREKITFQPLIPLGTRGKLRGKSWQVIGCQERGTEYDGQHFLWREYVLWNPFEGFRYLSEYNGHWNFITTQQSIPEYFLPGVKRKVGLGGRTYTHFQNSVATTWHVLGEFPWMVKVREQVAFDDYIAPPYICSAETTENEVTWSVGEYIAAAEVYAAFQDKKPAPAPIGVFANQPNPAEGKWRGLLWTWGVASVACLLMMIGFAVTSRSQVVFDQTFTLRSGTPAAEKSFVTQSFEVPGRGNLQVDVKADLNNAWSFIGMALINEETGTAYDFGEQVSYYSGTDSDGSWVEGDRKDSTILPNIPAGRYYLRVEPEFEAETRNATLLRADTVLMSYSIKLTRDVPYYFRYLLAAFLLGLPVLIPLIWQYSFEASRWQESDYAVVATGGDE